MFRYEPKLRNEYALFHLDPRKAKQEVKFKKPTFYSIGYIGYKLHQLVAPPPPKKSGVSRPIEHSKTVIACMSKQILALFQLKKLKKGDLFIYLFIYSTSPGPSEDCQ